MVGFDLLALGNCVLVATHFREGELTLDVWYCMLAMTVGFNQCFKIPSQTRDDEFWFDFFKGIFQALFLCIKRMKAVVVNVSLGGVIGSVGIIIGVQLLVECITDKTTSS